MLYLSMSSFATTIKVVKVAGKSKNTASTAGVLTTKTKPNAKCPCGSDKKYKKCCRITATASATAPQKDLHTLATEVLVEQLGEGERESKPTFEGASKLHAMVGPAHAQLKPHERQAGHPSWMLYTMITHAPLNAEVWDVLGHAFNAASAVGLPPAIGMVPGKSFIASMYNVYCAKKEGTDGQEEGVKGVEVALVAPTEEEKKATFVQWKQMSDLLSSALLLMFQKAKALGSDGDGGDGF